jgi:hypothetical protein
MNFGRADDSETVIAERLRDDGRTHAPDSRRGLPLIAVPFGLELSPTPEVAMLANRTVVRRCTNRSPTSCGGDAKAQ